MAIIHDLISLLLLIYSNACRLLISLYQQKNARSGAISSFDNNRHRARGDIRRTVKGWYLFIVKGDHWSSHESGNVDK